MSSLPSSVLEISTCRARFTRGSNSSNSSWSSSTNSFALPSSSQFFTSRKPSSGILLHLLQYVAIRQWCVDCLTCSKYSVFDLNFGISRSYNIGMSLVARSRTSFCSSASVQVSPFNLPVSWRADCWGGEGERSAPSTLSLTFDSDRQCWGRQSIHVQQ